MAKPKGSAKTGGRQKGTPNKLTADLKAMILEAAEKADKAGGTVGYLTKQAKENPTAFMSLLGKVLPMTVANDDPDGFKVITHIKRTIVDPEHSDS